MGYYWITVGESMIYALKPGIHDSRGHALTRRTGNAVEPGGFSAHKLLVRPPRIWLQWIGAGQRR
jgi:hypothetical protein